MRAWSKQEVDGGACVALEQHTSQEDPRGEPGPRSVGPGDRGEALKQQGDTGHPGDPDHPTEPIEKVHERHFAVDPRSHRHGEEVSRVMSGACVGSDMPQDAHDFSHACCRGIAEAGGTAGRPRGGWTPSMPKMTL